MTLSISPALLRIFYRSLSGTVQESTTCYPTSVVYTDGMIWFISVNLYIGFLDSVTYSFVIFSYNF